ncbi:MAG: class II SORL domain-containing protein [Candidatus Omnitrophota bacterium]
MPELKELLQTADWKAEKHVPVIEVADKAKKGEFFRLAVSVGKQIPHPNTTEHHIRWIEVFFLADTEKFPYQIGRFEFNTHGESALGPNTSTIFTHPEVVCTFKTDKPGSIFATSFCNIHGLWQASQKIELT